MEGLSNKPRVILLGGPTATGKTALSVGLAKKFDGEVISADSMQIYKGLDVGTAKITLDEMENIPHHMLDFLEPEEAFSVADFVERADKLIQEITKRGHLPIVVGGTGLYLSSLLNGVQFAPQKVPPELRAQLQKELEERGGQALYEELIQVDSQAAAGIHPNNHHRVLRALELYRATGVTMSQQKAESLPAEQPYDALMFCLDFPQRSQLYERIDLRVDRMMDAGLLKEAKLVYDHQTEYKTAAQAIGYKELFPYFEGEQELTICVDKLKQASRNYAKRQLTWFRRMPQVHWLDASASNVLELAKEQTCRHWPDYTL